MSEEKNHEERDEIEFKLLELNLRQSDLSDQQKEIEEKIRQIEIEKSLLEGKRFRCNKCNDLCKTEYSTHDQREKKLCDRCHNRSKLENLMKKVQGIRPTQFQFEGLQYNRYHDRYIADIFNLTVGESVFSICGADFEGLFIDMKKDQVEKSMGEKYYIECFPGGDFHTDPYECLKCPVCGDIYTHPQPPEVHEGEDQYQAWKGRGDLITFPFWCESGHKFNLNFGFHKGQTFPYWELMEESKVIGGVREPSEKPIENGEINE